MTKIGEGHGEPHEITIGERRLDIDRNLDKFQNALSEYKSADDGQRKHLKGVMDDSLDLIKAAISDVKQRDMHSMRNQQIKVEKEYKTYIKNESEDNASKLEEDITILKDYNKPA